MFDPRTDPMLNSSLGDPKVLYNISSSEAEMRENKHKQKWIEFWCPVIDQEKIDLQKMRIRIRKKLDLPNLIILASAEI